MYSKELTTFISVAEQGSFLKASKELYITPASVMNQMNKLEADIGVKLIERTNQGTWLTPAGHSIYKDAKKIVRQAESAIAYARQIEENEKRTISIGTSILRPCKMLVDLWAKIGDGTLPVTIRIVPFDDSPAGMEAMLETLGKEIDCFVSPCDNQTWKEQYNILILRQGECCIAVPRKHRLAKKKRLCWEDLDGETIMLVKRGNSPVLNRLHDEIETKHPKINILSIPHLYDVNIFNECEQTGYIMETLDIWQEIHPSIITLPMEWDYQMPYGIIYAKHPTKQLQEFVTIIQNNLNI